MVNSESEPIAEDKEQEKKESNDNAVLPQIGEDPGLSADVLDKDSKRKDREGETSIK